MVIARAFRLSTCSRACSEGPLWETGYGTVLLARPNDRRRSCHPPDSSSSWFRCMPLLVLQVLHRDDVQPRWPHACVAASGRAGAPAGDHAAVPGRRHLGARGEAHRCCRWNVAICKVAGGWLHGVVLFQAAAAGSAASTGAHGAPCVLMQVLGETRAASTS